jgi:hypothetical protein
MLKGQECTVCRESGHHCDATNVMLGEAVCASCAAGVRCRKTRGELEERGLRGSGRCIQCTADGHNCSSGTNRDGLCYWCRQGRFCPKTIKARAVKTADMECAA